MARDKCPNTHYQDQTKPPTSSRNRTCNELTDKCPVAQQYEETAPLEDDDGQYISNCAKSDGRRVNHTKWCDENPLQIPRTVDMAGCACDEREKCGKEIFMT